MKIKKRTSRRNNRHSAGITLVESLVVIVIIAALTGIAFKVVQKMNAKSHISQDLSNLRQMYAFLNLFSVEQASISVGDLRHYSFATMGGLIKETNFREFQNSRQWNLIYDKRNSVVKQKNGEMAAFTVNERLWSPLSASDPNYSGPWSREPALSSKIFGSATRPLLFHGVYLPGHNGAYYQGSLSHVAPVYSDEIKPVVGDLIQGKAVFLLSDGSTQLINTANTTLRW